MTSSKPSNVDPSYPELSHQDLREWCLDHAGVLETFPFGLETMVFKVGVVQPDAPLKGKIFALLALESDPPQISLKCDPARAESLRAEYGSIVADYHLSKKHWNTLSVDGTLPHALIAELITHSHALVAGSLTRLERAWLGLCKFYSGCMKKLMLLLTLTLASAQALELTLYPSFAEFREPVTVSGTLFTYALPLEKRSLMALDSLRLEGVNTLAQTLEFPLVPALPALKVKDPLEPYVGQRVFVRENGKLVALRLIRSGSEGLLVQEEESQLYRTDLKPQALLFSNLPAAPEVVPAAKPAYPPQFAQMNFEVEKPGQATLSYLSRALSWSPHYALEVGANGKAAIEAWADLSNMSLERVEADKVQLVAGKVNIVGFGGNPQAPIDYPVVALEDSGRAVGATAAVQNQGENAGNFSYLLRQKLTLERGSRRSVPFVEPKITVIKLIKPALSNRYDSRSGQNVADWQSKRVYRLSSDTFLPTGPITVREAGQLLGQVQMRDAAPEDPVDLELGYDPSVLFEKSVDKAPNRSEQETDPNGYKYNVTFYTTLITFKATNTGDKVLRLEYTDTLASDLNESGNIIEVTGAGQLNQKTLGYVLGAEILPRSSQSFRLKVVRKYR